MNIQALPEPKKNRTMSYRTFESRLFDLWSKDNIEDLFELANTLDEELNTPYINLYDNTILKNRPEEIDAAEWASRLIFAWAADYDFGESWPEGGIYDPQNNAMLYLRTPKELYAYIKMIAEYNHLYPSA